MNTYKDGEKTSKGVGVSTVNKLFADSRQWVVLKLVVCRTANN